MLLTRKNPEQSDFSLQEAKELVSALREAGAKSVCITSMKIDGQKSMPMKRMGLWKREFPWNAI